MVSKNNLDIFLKKCMKHYPDSLLMRFANREAQKEMMQFMVAKFLPEWKEAILNFMKERSINELDEDTILEVIHAKLYLEEGYFSKEKEIFQKYDPHGHEKFMKQSVQQALKDGFLKE